MFVPKKDGKLRLVVDFRQLNEITIKDRTPLPLINELKDRLAGKKIFTALDLTSAYDLIRIKPGHEWKTAFRTKFGLFEYLAMPQGLTNAPATFQRMINHVLREYLDVFVVCYLDDILIFSDSEEDHEEHVHKVLRALQKANLLVNPQKSEFHKTEVLFLGHKVSPGEIRMDPKKLEAVKDWKEPENVKEVQSFLGFANYYRRFLRNFGGIAAPLTDLTKKDKPFKWEPKAQEAFDKIKELILSEPVLKMFDPKRPIELETDASDFALGAQIGQRDDEGNLHPIAFYSHKLHGAELNYPIYDKEFLAILNAFKEFRHYLLGSHHQIKVFTDHKNITHFSTTQQLSGRQLRYAEYLSEFDYVIIHVKGTENGRADAISRRADLDTGKPVTNEQLFEKTEEGHLRQKRIATAKRKQTMCDTKYARRTYRLENGNKLLEDIILANEQIPEDERTDKMHVPENLTRPLTEELHEHPLHGHLGINKTLARLQETYTFPKMKKMAQKVVNQCHICKKIKAQRHKPYGELQPLPVAERPWDSITMDFITKLPLSQDPATGEQYDSILVIVDRFTKFSYFIPYQEATTAEQFSYIFLRNIVSTHGLPAEILSDRGPPFFSNFWQCLMDRLGLNHRMTTAWRPSADGQTERMNQVIETYLRAYINYKQND
jgi:hypothetical protein